MSFNSGAVQIATGDSSLTGPTNYGELYTAGTPSGSAVSTVNFQAAGTTTAGMVRIFLYDGSNWRLIKEIAVTAITPSGTVKAWPADLGTGAYQPAQPITLKNGWKIRVTTQNSETFNAWVGGAVDY